MTKHPVKTREDGDLAWRPGWAKVVIASQGKRDGPEGVIGWEKYLIFNP